MQVWFGMAANASGWCACVLLILVTGGAFQGGVLAVQREEGSVVFGGELIKGGGEEVKIVPLMFGVAGSAVWTNQTAVQPGATFALLANAHMAGFTAYGRDTGKCFVALGAVITESGMVGKATALLRVVRHS